MSMHDNSIIILMADDDQEDQMLTKDAFEVCKFANELRFVNDGQELLDYLLHQGQYADPSQAPRPGIILLDLNMPKKDGREALQEIKSHPDLKEIPIVVLTTSENEKDVHETYTLGANSYITKPVSFEKLVTVMKVLSEYWFDVVRLPQRN